MKRSPAWQFKLDHEIESYTNSNGALVAWVKAPLLSSTFDTVLYLYYGNSASTNQQNAAGVWDASFKGVWHLKENPTGTAPQMKDSTSNGNHGNALGAPASSNQRPGKTGGALHFDGVDDWITNSTGNAVSLRITDAMTIEAWVKPAVTSVYMGIAGKLADLPSDNGFSISKVNTDKFRLQVANGTSKLLDGDSALVETNWHHIVGVKSAGNVMTLYVDGIAQTATINSTMTDSTNAFHIGRQYVDFTGRFWNGIIDEVRVSNTNRSAAWISTGYNNQNSPATFYSTGSPESSPKDYRSVQTGNWNSTTTWESFDGSSWVAATNSPTSTDGVITIRSNHVVTVTAAVTVDQVVVEATGNVQVDTPTFQLLIVRVPAV